MGTNDSCVAGGRELTDLATDHLSGTGLSITIDFMDDQGRPAIVQPPRPPHRHAYHELIWNRCGIGRHVIDGQPHTIQAGTLTIVGRGQIHTFESGLGLSGAIVRFSDESLGDRSVVDSFPAWLLNLDSSRTITVPESETGRLESLLHILDDESRRPLDRLNLDLQHHLLCSLLLMVQRWHQSESTNRCAETVDVALYRRFRRILEKDFDRHHDTQHYAEVLRVPTAALSRSLARVSGKTTKELIVERVMLEAARLLSFSELTIGEIAFQAGFADQFYFSRAFKRRYGAAPLTYRARSRGAPTTPSLQRHHGTQPRTEKSMDAPVLPIP